MYVHIHTKLYILCTVSEVRASERVVFCIYIFMYLFRFIYVFINSTNKAEGLYSDTTGFVSEGSGAAASGGTGSESFVSKASCSRDFHPKYVLCSPTWRSRKSVAHTWRYYVPISGYFG